MNSTVLDRGVAVPPSRAVAEPDSASAVSWAAVFAGAVAAASLSLILLVLGVGFGFTALSPWHSGPSATTFGVSSILWVTLTSLIVSALGGYIAGRLRTRWVGTHADEVYFRDTAHGFLAWGVATLVTAGVLTSAIGSIAGTAADVGASVAGGAATAATAAAAGGVAAGARNGGSEGGLGYFTDSLFRRDAAAAPAASGTTPTADSGTASPNAEAGRILVQSLRTGTLSADDTRYVAQLVAQKTGMSQQDAEKRVTDTFTRAKAAADEAVNKAKEAADTARKAAAAASFWIFVSLLLGAFGASLAATFGGRQRDHIA